MSRREYRIFYKKVLFAVQHKESELGLNVILFRSYVTVVIGLG
jgi:hypothetical protein